jgi:hypothetical protein
MLKAFDMEHDLVMDWDVSRRLKITDISDILATEYVVVDGDELSWVINSYLNLPIHRSEEPQIWTGDMARFIVAQLPAEDGQQ